VKLSKSEIYILLAIAFVGMAIGLMIAAWLWWKP